MLSHLLQCALEEGGPILLNPRVPMEMGPYCEKTTALVENHNYFMAQSYVNISSGSENEYEYVFLYVSSVQLKATKSQHLM